ncbi:MAG: AMP-binding enzyme [Streptosporangiaceae bacterium]
MNFNLAVILTETASASPEKAVAEAAVVGIPDERLGEEVMAVVKLRADWSLMAADLIGYCRERMAAYKYPRIMEFRDELPKNTLGKVLKDELIRH